MVSARRPHGHLRKWTGLAALLAVAALEGCATSGSGRGAPAPMSRNAIVLEAILQPVFADGDFQPLFDRLADDVVLEVATSGDARLSRELRGKREVMAFLLDEDAVDGFRRDGSLQYSGSGDRVVVRGVETDGVEKRGMTVRGRESAVVVDFRNGRIIRFLVIQNPAPAQVAARKSRRVEPNHESER